MHDERNSTGIMFPVGVGRRMLENAGIQLFSFSLDNYSDRGATSFKLHYQGMIIEMMGKKDLDQIAKGQLDTWTTQHTRVKVTGEWVRIHFHPGRYARYVCSMH